ncbi:MAG: hypothetical protein INR62_14305, partial [Rhodospirillales bacterium]|nr:hypothetical protein [Acetobacter sp.]
SEEAICQRLGITLEERRNGYRDVQFINHEWQNPEMLRSLGCDEMQGFLLAHPQEAEQLRMTMLAPEPEPFREESEEGAAYLLPGFA